MLKRSWGFLSNLFSEAEWRISLWYLVFGVGGLAASISIPAWAVSTMDMFQQYQPLSWVIAGFSGAALWATIYFVIAISASIRVRAKYNSDMRKRGSFIDPMAKTFHDQRIYLSDLCLPSHPYVSEKMFHNCEIVGPSNIFLRFGNNLRGMKLPYCDAVALGENQNSASNCTIFDDCVFHDCSFKSVTFLFRPDDAQNFSTLERLKWVTTDTDDIQISSDDPKSITDETDGNDPKSKND